METTTEVTDAPETAADTAGFSGRIRNSLVLVQSRITAAPARARAQWADLPEHLGGLTDRIATRVRESLDLPSKADLEDLIARVDEIDDRIAKLFDAPKKPKAKKPAAKKPATRRDAIKAAASKRTKKN